MAVIAIFQLSKKLSPFPSPAKKCGTTNKRGLQTVKTSYIYRTIPHDARLRNYDRFVMENPVFSSIAGLFYVKSNYEEELLSEKFQEYESYQKKTGRFFPKF